MNTTLIKDSILTALAAVGAVIANTLGGWDVLLRLLIAMMCADYVTGIVVAGVFKKSNKTETGTLSSEACFRGIVRKCGVLLLVYIAVLLDEATGAHYARSAVMLFTIGNEGLSLLENLGLMGVKYPPTIQNMLQAMHEQGKQDGG